MRLGVTVRPTQSIVDAAETARLIEDLGYQSAWIADHYFHREAAAALALMMTATNGLTLGTAVMSPLLRHPTLLASLAATLREIGPDRFILGLGVGGYEFASELGIASPRPLRITEEATAIVRELTAGRAEVSGDTFSAKGSQLRWAAADGPVYLAARGPKMLQLAGRIADGVITHGISAAHIDFVRDRVAAGAAQAAAGIADGTSDPGSSGRSISLALMLDVEVDGDETRAWAGLRPRCLTMAAGAYADELIPVYGLDPEQVGLARTALRSGDRAAAAALVTDDMAKAFGLAGSAGRIADGLAELEQRGVDEVIISVGGSDAAGYRTQLTDLAKEIVR